MLEKDIEKYLTAEVKKLKGRAYKWVSPGNAGVPDRIVVFPEGLVVFVELKAPGKKSTPLQLAQQRRLIDKSFDVRVIDSKEGVDDLIKNAEEWLS